MPSDFIFCSMAPRGNPIFIIFKYLSTLPPLGIRAGAVTHSLRSSEIFSEASLASRLYRAFACGVSAHFRVTFGWLSLYMMCSTSTPLCSMVFFGIGLHTVYFI